MYLYVYLYIYICIYIRNAIVRLPYLRSGDSQGQETFSATSAEKQTRNHDTVLIEYIEYIDILDKPCSQARNLFQGISLVPQEISRI